MFKGLLINPITVQLLERYVQNPSHATLITGPSGNGINSITEHLARHLLGIPYDRTLVNEPHVRILEPNDGTIAVETIRGLRAFFLLKVPGKSKVARVVVIKDADCLSIEAQNSLLKLLEEPPEGSVLLLSSSDPKRLLLTIQSRLSVLLLIAPGKEQIIEWFTQQKYSKVEIERAFLMAKGAPERIASILSGEGGEGFLIARSVLSGKTFERLLQVDTLSKDKLAAQSFVTSLAQIASASLERAASQNPERVEQWQNILAASLTASNALERNGNAKLVLTDLMLTL
jgi:hypothetical protein